MRRLTWLALGFIAGLIEHREALEDGLRLVGRNKRMTYTYPLAVAAGLAVLVCGFGAVSHYQHGMRKTARRYGIIAVLALGVLCFAVADLYEHPEKVARHGPSPHPECELGVC